MKGPEVCAEVDERDKFCCVPKTNKKTVQTKEEKL